MMLQPAPEGGAGIGISVECACGKASHSGRYQPGIGAGASSSSFRDNRFCPLSESSRSKSTAAVAVPSMRFWRLYPPHTGGTHEPRKPGSSGPTARASLLARVCGRNRRRPGPWNPVYGGAGHRTPTTGGAVAVLCGRSTYTGSLTCVGSIPAVGIGIARQTTAANKLCH